VNSPAGFLKRLTCAACAKQDVLRFPCLWLPARGFHGESAVCARLLFNQALGSPETATGFPN